VDANCSLAGQKHVGGSETTCVNHSRRDHRDRSPGQAIYCVPHARRHDNFDMVRILLALPHTCHQKANS